MKNTMENIEEKPAIDKFFYILNSQFTKRPMHFDRVAIEAILRMRGRSITEAEKETDSTNKELMIKEIERIDNNIAEYKTKCIQYFKEIDPELEGYEPYKSNDEQPEKEAGGESEDLNYLSFWGLEIVKILMKLKEGEGIEHADLKRKLYDVETKKIPPSYGKHLSDIFKTPKAKKFYKNEIVRSKKEWKLKSRSKFKM